MPSARGEYEAQHQPHEQPWQSVNGGQDTHEDKHRGHEEEQRRTRVHPFSASPLSPSHRSTAYMRSRADRRRSAPPARSSIGPVPTTPCATSLASATSNASTETTTEGSAPPATDHPSAAAFTPTGLAQLADRVPACQGTGSSLDQDHPDRHPRSATRLAAVRLTLWVRDRATDMQSTSADLGSLDGQRLPSSGRLEHGSCRTDADRLGRGRRSRVTATRTRSPHGAGQAKDLRERQNPEPGRRIQRKQKRPHRSAHTSQRR